MKVAWADEGSQMDVDAGGVETSGPGTDAGAVETSGPGTDVHSDDDDVFGGASSAAQSGLGDNKGSGGSKGGRVLRSEADQNIFAALLHSFSKIVTTGGKERAYSNNE